MKIQQYIRRRQYRLASTEGNQSGINMADLMMWLVIAALLVAAALQAIGSFQKGAYIYQMKNDLRGAVSLANTNGALEGGQINEPQVAAAVVSSNKSEGVTLTWGIVEPPNSSADGHNETPQAQGEASFNRVSVVQSLVDGSLPHSVPAYERTGRASYILVAHHDKVPDISVVYFFNDVSPYYTGTAVIRDDEDFEIIGGTEAAWTEPAPSSPEAPEVAPPPATSPSTPTSPSPSPTASAAPPAQGTQPEIPAANKNPKTKKFMFCHNGAMHSNSFNGMVSGHENHPQDIMPPIPPLNYAGNNWNAATAKVFYNNCVPV